MRGRDFLKKFDRMRRWNRIDVIQSIFERSMLDVVHYKIGRFDVPADVQQLDDISVGGQHGQFLDFASQQLDVSGRPSRIKFDRNFSSRLLVRSRPDFTISPAAQKFFNCITRDLGGRTSGLNAQVAQTCAIRRAIVAEFGRKP